MGVQRNVKEEDEKMLDEGLDKTQYIRDEVTLIEEHRLVKI